MKKNSKRNISRYPYMIHADPLMESTSYPTHTHGLTDVGMPEILMDPLSFGGEENGKRINSAYRFFKKQANSKKLKTILNGQTIKLTGKQLDPKYMRDDPYIYCFREVTPEFEAVKLSYNKKEITEDMRFIQIYVEGDDYALMDDYYRGGVRW